MLLNDTTVNEAYITATNIILDASLEADVAAAFRDAAMGWSVRVEASNVKPNRRSNSCKSIASPSPQNMYEQSPV
jgi:hypothetical protein